MDRARVRVKRILAISALVFVAAAASSPLLLREQAWTAAGETLADDLTRAPGECLAERTQEVEIGRALFRSPALLGGPAARLGLSCNACHSDGRVNAHFLLPELTNRAGAADVTSEWSSHVRGDGVMNPVDIPDLTDASRRAGFGRARDPSLEHFVRSVIIEEFQGSPPPDPALAGVVAYVRALSSTACAPPRTLTLASAADEVRRALAAAEGADAPTASLLALAAQDAIGRIVERLPPRRFAGDRRRLEALARELGAVRDDDIVVALETLLPGWRARFDAAIARIARRERRTYFNQATLRADLSAP